MIKCDTCKSAIFDPVMGEYKCEKKKRYVQESIDSDCKDYANGEPAMSKVDYDLEDDD